MTPTRTVLAGLLLLAVVGGGVASWPGSGSPTLDGRPVLTSDTEVVLAPGTDELVASARVDTGATRTAIDDDLADRLDLPVVDTVSVRSASGEEERDVVAVPVAVDGRATLLEVAVADRDELTYPVLLGRDLLTALDALVDPVAGDRALADHVVAPPEVELALRSDVEAVDTEARLDSGAERTSVDDDLVDDLDIETDGAATVRVRSALGVEERPLVDLTVRFGTGARPLTVSVAERDELLHPVLLGRDALAGVLVDVQVGT